MKILVTGAGALGGYFGGKLALAGRDVTFMVRRKRAQRLADVGALRIRNPEGEDALPNPQLILSGEANRHFDLVLVACKSYSLNGCIRDFAPAVGPETMILPVLNGMRHIDVLRGHFGGNAVLGGRSVISAFLDPDGTVVRVSNFHRLDFGELDGADTPRIRAVEKQLAGCGFDAALSMEIVRWMWEKWARIAALAGGTCLMRSAIGDILRAGGKEFLNRLFAETNRIAALNGYAPGEKFLADTAVMLSDNASTQTASMLKDIENGFPVESDQIVGDLLERVPEAERGEYPLLGMVNLHLKSYEERRERR